MSNFPFASHSTRGVFCAACRDSEYPLFLPGKKSRPFHPPGYWYTDYALSVPAAGAAHAPLRGCWTGRHPV